MKSVAMQQNVTMDQPHMPPLNPASSIRYDICLEAPTAAAQKIDEPPLTYLNKGQHYNITLKDVKGYDGDIISTAIITFHDEAHRAGATDYWKFWLSHQNNAEKAKAIDLDISRSNGIHIIEHRQFDRIVFRWNGKAGASIYVKFNCLSTDFSRIKGVKGIPLRLQIESYQQGVPHIEKTYSRIKLFRDKGAERKNKDDARHIERQLEKLRGKNGEPHPLWLAYSPTSPVTVFRELVTPEEDMAEDMHRRGLIASPGSSNILLPLPSPVPAPVNFMPGPMRRSFSTSFQPVPAVDMHYPFSAQVPIGYDPSYVPQRRRRIAKLSVLIKFESDDVYRAIYLEHLTVKELTEKIIERSDIKKPVSKVIRKFKRSDKKSIVVRMEDDVVKDMQEEQDILVQTEDNEDGQSVTLVLVF
ncbi:hypothetical protein G6F70_002892 [Rhizopus microsporus]|nr:hypothetical protein G6F71_001630 [Rhizopus microsporus]KAG1201743.1 hypothetical protein G6F70_002892 [Rhizopus microsporus]KAG1213344.1 hypothetical protein G6F69_002905 [Rhizopus microsporus]KAG1235882.1 hypothetical protein G6F67_002430 [Rhizopus microsporus]KAG1266740.1 hypothetical protein G6F68_002483 [Rhizopus microsporus]